MKLGGLAMEEMKKEIQSIRKRSLYLSIAFLISSILMFFTTINLCRRCSVIQDYYFQSVQLHQELNRNLENLSPMIKEFVEENQ